MTPEEFLKDKHPNASRTTTFNGGRVLELLEEYGEQFQVQIEALVRHNTELKKELNQVKGLNNNSPGIGWATFKLKD